MSRPTCADVTCDRAAIRTRQDQRWCLYHPDAQPPAIDPKTGKPIGREGARERTTEGRLVSTSDGYEVWTAVMEDAVDRGEIHYLHERRISGHVIPATYWNPAVERHPLVHLYDAAAVLASACACRGRLHPQCVWPTIQRGEQTDMPDDWRDWTQADA